MLGLLSYGNYTLYNENQSQQATITYQQQRTSITFGRALEYRDLMVLYKDSLLQLRSSYDTLQWDYNIINAELTNHSPYTSIKLHKHCLFGSSNGGAGL